MLATKNIGYKTPVAACTGDPVTPSEARTGLLQRTRWATINAQPSASKTQPLQSTTQSPNESNRRASLMRPHTPDRLRHVVRLPVYKAFTNRLARAALIAARAVGERRSRPTVTRRVQRLSGRARPPIARTHSGRCSRTATIQAR